MSTQVDEYVRIESFAAQYPTWLVVVVLIAVGFCLRRLIRMGLTALAHRRRQ